MKNKIKFYLNEFGITKYTLFDDNSVSVYQSVGIKQKMKELPLQFRHIEGDLNVFSLGLETAKGLPQTMSGSLAITNNNLSSFDGFPHSIGKDLHISFNQFKSLKDLKTSIGKTLYCDNNPLESLDIRADVENKVYFYDEANIHRRLKGFEEFYDSNGFLSVEMAKLKSTILNHRLQSELSAQNYKKSKKI